MLIGWIKLLAGDGCLLDQTLNKLEKPKLTYPLILPLNVKSIKFLINSRKNREEQETPILQCSQNTVRRNITGDNIQSRGISTGIRRKSEAREKLQRQKDPNTSINRF